MSDTHHEFSVAIVGSGNMAKEHARALMDEPAVKIVGVCSRTHISAEAFANRFDVPVVCENIHKLYSETHADVLVIAVSETSLSPILEEAMTYPWLILIEKPAGVNLTESRHLCALATLLDSRVLVALNRRQYSSTRSIMTSIQECEGNRFLEVHDQENPIAASRMGRPSLVTNNWMFANSIHLIDYFSLFSRGSITEFSSKTFDLSSTAFAVVANFEYSSGDLGSYIGLWNTPGPWSFSISIGESRWEAKPLEQAAKQHLDSPIEILPSDEQDKLFKPGLRMQVTELIRHLKTGRSSIPTIQEAFESVELVSKIYSRE